MSRILFKTQDNLEEDNRQERGNIDESQIEIKQSHPYKRVCGLVMFIVDISFLITEVVMSFYILSKIDINKNRQRRPLYSFLFWAFLIACIFAVVGITGKIATFFNKFLMKKLKCCKQLIVKNAYQGLLVPAQLLYIRVEGHDVAIIGTISSYFIWVMFAVAVIVLVNPIACKKRKSDNKFPILWLVFGLFSWVLNLFIIGIEIYVGFLLSLTSSFPSTLLWS